MSMYNYLLDLGSEASHVSQWIKDKATYEKKNIPKYLDDFVSLLESYFGKWNINKLNF